LSTSSILRLAALLAMTAGIGAASSAAAQTAQRSADELARALEAQQGCTEDPDTGALSPGCQRIGPNERGFSLTAPTAAPPPKGKSSGRPTGAAPPRPGQPKVSAIPRPVGLDLLINFENASSTLTRQARANAAALAQALTTPRLAGRRLAIEGHTNAVGARVYNQALSAARANAVVEFLVSQGVARDRLDATGYGFDRLRNPRNPAAPENRRVEARLLN
jgi:OmpA-OmpF porin, OOP family